MARRTVAEFLEGFVLPLVAGGELRIGRPLSIEDLQQFEVDLGEASVPLVEVDEARAEVLSEIVVRPPALVLDADELSLAAALHNVLFLIHPRSGSWLVTKGSLSEVARTAQHFASRPPSTDRRRVLARHGLLHNLLDLTRHDTTLSWWTGKATFFGQEPPRRLTRWRGLRRVHEEQSVADFEDLLATPQVAPIVASLLRRSPLTLLLAHPQVPAGAELHWEDAAFVLRDAELARAVAFHAVAPEDQWEKVAAPARFAAGFEQMLERNPPLPDLRAVAAFLVHLNLLLALAESRRRSFKGPSPLLATVLAPERAAQRPRGLTTFFALPGALALVDRNLAEPPGLRDEPALARRWDHHRAEVREGVGQAVIETLAGRLRRHLQGVPSRLDEGSRIPNG